MVGAKHRYTRPIFRVPGSHLTVSGYAVWADAQLRGVIRIDNLSTTDQLFQCWQMAKISAKYT